MTDAWVSWPVISQAVNHDSREIRNVKAATLDTRRLEGGERTSTSNVYYIDAGERPPGDLDGVLACPGLYVLFNCGANV